MDTALPSHKVPLTIVADIITFIAEKPTSKLEDIMLYTNKSKSYITSGLRIAKMLEIITDDEQDTKYVVKKEAMNALGKTPSVEIKINIMRKYIQQYEPFISFVQFCMNDNTVTEAAQKVFALYNFKGKNFEMLRDLFTSWGNTTEIFSIESDKIVLDSIIDAEFKRIESPYLALDNDMAIRLYIGNRLGTDLSALMDPVDIDELTNALKKYHKESREAIGCAGRAFENYLRRIAINVGVDVSTKNGITQIIEFVKSNKKIHSKHNSIGGSIGAIRNMSGHGVDPKELEPWELTPQSALAFIELVISTIRSLYMFINRNILTF